MYEFEAWALSRMTQKLRCWILGNSLYKILQNEEIRRTRGCDEDL